MRGKAKRDPRDYISCPNCGQRGNERPGLHFIKGGAEAASFAGDGPDPLVGSTDLALQWIECRKCAYRWPVAAGTVTPLTPAQAGQ